jgi:hypothetical protein
MIFEFEYNNLDQKSNISKQRPKTRDNFFGDLEGDSNVHPSVTVFYSQSKNYVTVQ